MCTCIASTIGHWETEVAVIARLATPAAVTRDAFVCLLSSSFLSFYIFFISFFLFFSLSFLMHVLLALCGDHTCNETLLETCTSCPFDCTNSSCGKFSPLPPFLPVFPT